MRYVSFWRNERPRIRWRTKREMFERGFKSTFHNTLALRDYQNYQVLASFGASSLVQTKKRLDIPEERCITGRAHGSNAARYS